MSLSLYMDAAITPNRSLTRRGLIILIAVITVANCASALVFLAMGAVFVPVFLGLDVLAVVVAFIVSFRAARRVERVQVSARNVTVTRETPKGSLIVWESPTAFTRLNIDRDEEQRVLALRLAQSGRETLVAAALRPAERSDFAKALDTAIWQARRGG